jgi:tRNA pseudouridine55 synthase
MVSQSIEGFLVVDKPGGLTSRDAVNRIQRLLPRGTKIGHTGTLDPLATGVLVFCIGKATKFADRVQAMGKTYVTRIRLGATSTTDDADGDVTIRDVAPVGEAAIRELLPAFTGTILQQPPAFSALKVDGRRAHDLARRGLEVALEPRPVTVLVIDLLHYAWPFLDLEIACGKGTYIRAIARDLGDRLGVGGLVLALRRTNVGPFTVEAGISLDTDRATVLDRLVPVEAILNLAEPQTKRVIVSPRKD